MDHPQDAAPELDADRFYDAGDLDCSGPGLKEIRDLVEGLEPGQTLEIRTVSEAGRADLEAWIRMRGYESLRERAGTSGDRYLVRRGPG